jgi:hypothetical protein
MRQTLEIRRLGRELHSAGATSTELDELLPVAADLRLLGQHNRARLADRSNRLRLLRFVPSLVVGAAAGMAVIVWSQSAMPTSWLFPVQKASDSIAIAAHPEYRATVMMKRAQQVNQLVKAHAGSGEVLATLADYSQQASAYKSTAGTNYAAFEYCKSNLEQAVSTASPAVKQAILNNLQALENV